MRSPIVLERFVVNPHARARTDGTGGSGPSPLAFHRRLPGYLPTRSRSLPGLAARLGVGQILVKDESSRLGLPSFKVLGASWAAYRALCARLGHEPEWRTIKELTDAFSPLRPLSLRTATDGNHGRAVAWFARQAGLDAYVLVPAGTAQARIDAVQGEGARVEMVDGTYDDAVHLAADCDPATALVVSDTSWPGYEEIPGWVIEGYRTIFEEIDAQFEAMGEPMPDVVPIQLGVGALGAAAAGWARRHGAPERLRLLGVEPATADCVLASIVDDRLTEVPGPHRSIMSGLNCGLPSPLAFPRIRDSFSAFASIADSWACDAMRALANEAVVAGETGAAGVAGVTAVLQCGGDVRDALELGSTSRVLAIVTEGATDPAAYARIVGRLP
jgi:diaminopropionate ammonia-lyase